EKIIANCGGISVSAKIWYGGESSYENVEILSGVDEVKSADMIFAVGGGKALDTCKCLSDKLGKPVFTFPTVAS
ncbi:iron-containing alcohol dehydrogenase, partial [Anaerostipes caccae]